MIVSHLAQFEMFNVFTQKTEERCPGLQRLVYRAVRGAGGAEEASALLDRGSSNWRWNRTVVTDFPINNCDEMFQYAEFKLEITTARCCSRADPV